jgi:hypothetical protein
MVVETVSTQFLEFGDSGTMTVMNQDNTHCHHTYLTSSRCTKRGKREEDMVFLFVGRAVSDKENCGNCKLKCKAQRKR